MPMINISIIKGILISSSVDVENVQHRKFFSVAELIQNQADDSVDIDIFMLIPSWFYKIKP
jgi:hypothetical protein